NCWSLSPRIWYLYPYFGIAAAFQRQFYRFVFLPGTAGKVRHIDGVGAVGDRPFTQGSNGTPKGRVIDVLIQRKAVSQAVDQPPVHHKVHATMAADFLGHFAYF